jgi:hypothetical protein
MRTGLLLSLSLLLLVFRVEAEPEDSATQECRKAYENLFSGPEFKIGIFLGYSEVGKNVTDGPRKAALASLLSRKCVRNQGLCGFSRDVDDADHFAKTIVAPNGQKKRIILTVMNSSYSENDTENKGTYANLQADKSDGIRAAFLKSLREDDAVFYLGHSRHGTGPGFKPMGALDWANALASKPALAEMLDTLKISGAKPKILGMLSCLGEQHYAKLLSKAAPTSALLLIRQTAANTDLERTLASALNALLARKCERRLQKDLQEATRYFRVGLSDQGISIDERFPVLYNFFAKNKKSFADPPSILTQELDYFYGEDLFFPSAVRKAGGHPQRNVE